MSSDPTSDPAPGPAPRYRIVYSELVRRELAELIRRARDHGLGTAVRDAVREIDRRLAIYPQFGQPLRDLHQESACIWIGVVPPLVVQYAIHQDRREVWVVVPMRPLPRFLPDAPE